jgi:hypothetical protein
MNPENAMQPELQNKLTSILNWVEETAKQAEGFVVEQTPLYIQELLAWNFWNSLIVFSIGVALLIILAICLKKIFNSNLDFWDNHPEKALPLAIIAVISLFVGPPLTISNLEWIQITVAPRVWLVEYVASKL